MKQIKLSMLVFAVLSAGLMINLTLLQDGQTRRNAPLSDLSAKSSVAKSPDHGDAAGQDDGRQALIVLNSTDNAAETTKAIQRNLKALGFEPGPVDGRDTVMTRAAIMAFEHDHGLPLNALPSKDILEKIVFAGAGQAPASEPGPARIVSQAARDIIIKVQQSLRGLGYDTGVADGVSGPATTQAIRDFEVDQDLPVTGRISGRVVARLARLDDRGRIALGE